MPMARLFLLAASLLVGAAGSANAQGTLNLYCSVPVAWCQLMGTEFQRATGIRVNVTQKSTGEMLAQIRAEAQNPRGDVWWTGQTDPHLVAAQENLTQPYTPRALGDLEEWATSQWRSSGNRTIGVGGLIVAIGYNTELLQRRNLQPPRCWADLLRPEYRDEIQISNPNSSGTAYTIIATLVQLMGEDQAFAFMSAMHANVNSYPRSGIAPTRALARGETGISLGFVQTYYAERRGGFPVESVIPCEGTALGIDSMSIIRGARNVDNARRFYEWALSPEAQALGQTVDQLQMPSNRRAARPPGTPDMAGVNVIDYDFARFGNAETRRRLIERWDREIGNRPR